MSEVGKRYTELHGNPILSTDLGTLTTPTPPYSTREPPRLVPSARMAAEPAPDIPTLPGAADKHRRLLLPGISERSIRLLKLAPAKEPYRLH